MFTFGLAVSLGVSLLFGLAPAMRASAVKPASALKGGDDPHSRRRLMHLLIAAQVAFCFLVLFVAGLFVLTFDQLSKQSTGFSSERLLTLNTATQPAAPITYWDQVGRRLRALPGVETVAMAGWPLLSGNGSNGVISINGAPPTDELAYFLNVSPGWLDAMKIPLMGGRDLRPSDAGARVAMINETFAKHYFGGQNPVGKFFERGQGDHPRVRFEVVGMVRDARYRNMREPITPTAYVAFGDQPTSNVTFIVRTSGSDPLAMAAALRQAISNARSDFRVSNTQTQKEINESQTIRERLLAILALFFAVVALLLAGVGLYGVLDYSVLQRRREIGIRMAIGAGAVGIVRLVTLDVFSMVVAGAAAGLASGLFLARYAASLFYQVKPTDIAILAMPSLTILAAALLAAFPAAIRAVKVDPVETLRAE